MCTLGVDSTATRASRQKSCRPPWPSTTVVRGCRRASAASCNGALNGGVPSWKSTGMPSSAATSQIGSRPGVWAENDCTQGWSLTPRMRWSRTQRVISSAASGSLGSTVANSDVVTLTVGDEPRERVVGGHAGPAQTVECEGDGELDTERRHELSVLGARCTEASRLRSPPAGGRESRSRRGLARPYAPALIGAITARPGGAVRSPRRRPKAQPRARGGRRPVRRSSENRVERPIAARATVISSVAARARPEARLGLISPAVLSADASRNQIRKGWDEPPERTLRGARAAGVHRRQTEHDRDDHRRSRELCHDCDVACGVTVGVRRSHDRGRRDDHDVAGHDSRSPPVSPGS